LRDTLIPTANDALRYYLTRFKRDAQGKLLITPTQSVETYWYEVVNDTPSVAGLNSVVARLLALSPALTTREDRAFWEQVNSATPTVPIEKSASSSRILPAERFNPKRSNVENPELYAVWPFRLFGVGRPEVETGRVTFQKRHEKSTVGWSYDAHCAAYLGLAEEAARQLARKAANSHPGHRFPAMWGPNYDWLPDQDHGSCLMLTLQTMLIQPVGDKIYLLPAWPKDWSASFKLHAPNRTTIEGRVRDGKLVLDRVTPEERRKDVVIAESFL
jgi:hypothetical protein